MRATNLHCGCCGEYFKTWPEYTDQDQDTGYGVCASCQDSIKAHDKAEMQKVINVLAEGLLPDNRIKYLAMDFELQASVAMAAINEGQITCSIVRR